MKQRIKACVHTLLASVIALLLLLCISLAVAQTNWAKQWISDLAKTQLQASGIHAEIKGLEGQLPLSWKIEQVDLKFADGKSLTLEHLTLRLAFFPLLRGHLRLDYVSADSAEYLFFQSAKKIEAQETNWEIIQQAVRKKIQEMIPLLHLSVRHLKIARVHTHNLTTDANLDFSLDATGNWKKNNSEFLLLCKVGSLGSQKIQVEFLIQGSKRKQEIHTALKAHTDTVENLPLTHPIPFEAEALIELELRGPWKTWEALVWNTPASTPALTGNLRGKLTNLSFPKNTLLQRDWLISSEFALSSTHRCLIEQLKLYSDLFQLHAKAEIQPNLKKSKATITYTIPDLSPFSPFFRALVEGKASGRGFYRNGKLQTLFYASDLYVNDYCLQTLKAHLVAKQKSTAWQGSAEFGAKEGIFPFRGHLAFHWEPGNFLNFADFSFSAQESLITGNLNLALSHQLLDGSIYGNIRHLSQFAPLFPQANLNGSIGGELILSSTRNANGAQNVRLNLLSKNFRYGNYLVDDLSLTAQIADLYHTPQGEIELLAEKIYTPNAYFNQFFLRTHSNQSGWPFYLNVLGPTQDPCDLGASGTWKKRDDTFFFRFDRAVAEIAGEKIALQSPFQLDLSPSHLHFSASEWKVGRGSLATSGFFAPDKALAQWKMEHFPLQVLSILKPQFSLHGSISANGFLRATEENIQGNLNIALEEADFLHYGKKKPWRAKGSVQAHVDHSMLQIHSDLHAAPDQFLDFSASMPLIYNLFPFQITINDMRPLSAELVAEGRVQDIFDFVNIGTHHITGFASGRLLLSNTFSNPSLQGEIQLQNGSYENYYTGTFLKEIDAQAEAFKGEIHLIDLSATDGEKGALQAEGVLRLEPEANYPYAFSCELDNLHVLQFDTVDARLTGPLYVTGTTRSALAEGNLAVPYATIRIPDRLPYEIPQVPVTYINRPSYLDTQQIVTRSVFPFHLDLELSAEQDVYVEGKGLSSEWQGAVHLTGTNTTVAANGSLSLLSGNYLFSGKIFKLTDGEILFNDKPAPSAYLKLSGDLNLGDTEVTAQLRGPLTTPQLTFQSNPHLPTSSILARILFNKDVADISHPEAIQLANALMSLSGGAGPDVLEAIRKSIGVDRLTIVSASAGSDQIAVQIGKYLTKGVLITLSQSATSSQVIVEVELKKGFIFQAETQEDEEGKFSLKWRKTY